ncbi:MAG: T9SS type A sorting domain-containing protein [Bacteroidia bacterium]
MKNLIVVLALILPFLVNGQCDSLLKTENLLSPVCENEYVNFILTDLENRKGGVWSSNNPNFSTFQVKGYIKTNTTFYYTYIDSIKNCTAVDSIYLRSNKVPELRLLKPADVCWNTEDFPLTFNATPYGGTWFDTVDTRAFVENGRFFPNRTPRTDGGKLWAYSLFYTYKDPGTQCTDTNETIINVKQLPIVNLKYDAIRFSTKDTLLLLDTLIQFPENQSGYFNGPGVIYKKDSGFYFDPAEVAFDTVYSYNLVYRFVWKIGSQPYCENYDTVKLTLTKSGITTDINTTQKIAAVYPNPTKGELNIEDELPFKLEVYNSQGQIIIVENTLKKSHTLNLPKGVYWLRLESVNQSKTQKVIVH